jgi:hypothetical protein
MTILAVAIECTVEIAGLTWFVVFYHGRWLLVNIAELSLSLYKVSTTQGE